MDIATILIGLAIAAAVIAYVAEPLTGKPGRARSRPKTSGRAAELEAKYRLTLDAIRDLDFDFQTGKVLEPDYRALREKYAAQGVALLKELDGVGKGDKASEAQRSQADEIEAMIQARRRQTRQGRTCPACGQLSLPGDRFCSRCGAALAAKGEM